MQIPAKEIILSVAPPFMFNAPKHHLGVIRSLIDYVRQHPDTATWVLQQLENIGSPVTDIYSGELSVKSIVEEIEKLLMQNNILEEPGYRNWLKAFGRDYNYLELSDGSRWLFRLGEKPERYIHFHPAKHSQMSFRVRGSTLRTAIAVSVLYIDLYECCLEKVNRVRHDFLGLSPIKHVSPENGIGKLLRVCFSEKPGKDAPI